MLTSAGVLITGMAFNHISINYTMKLNRKYPYKHYNRFSDTTGRKYLVDNIKVPSVTTILSATKDKRFLDNWRRKVGEKEADRIMNKHLLLELKCTKY